jgi:multidrug efflux system membrane fusion protein
MHSYTGKPSSHYSYAWRIGAACIAALITAACTAESHSATTPPAAAGGRSGRGRGNAAVPVTTAVALQKAVPVTVKAVGTVEPVSSVQVRAQVTGQLSAVNFKEGQDVQEGQLLFTIDSRPFDAALAQAKAVLAKDTAQAQNARTLATRYTELFQRGLVPRTDYDAQTASAASSEAVVAADQAAIEAAALNVQFTKIPAPAAGRTGSITAHPGDLVRANDTNPLVVINRIAPIYVTFSVPGNLLDQIRRYQATRPLKVDARLSQTTDTHATGTVTFIDNAVDPTTGTIKLKGTFPNDAHALWPGLFVDVNLQLSVEPHAVVVPTTAVQTGQSGTFVYVVKDDHTVDMRPVAIARAEGTESVVTSGLTNGEVVVTDGQLQLTPGAHIADRSSPQRAE